MRRKILHIRSGFLVGGPEKLILNSLSCSDKSEFDFLLASFSVSGKENQFLEYASNIGLNTIDIRVSGSYDFSAISNIKSIIKEQMVELIVTHDYRANFLTLLATNGKKIPIVAVAHGWTSQDAKVKFYETLEKKLLRFSDKVIAVSKEKYEELKMLNIPEDKIELIENGIIVPKIEDTAKSDQFKKELGLESDCFLVGTVGRMSVEKGHIYFLEAVKELVKYHDKLKFVIVGDGALRDETEDYINKNGLERSVFLPGWLSDVETVYRGLDLFLLSSLTEGLPVALLEAMSYRLPVIVTKVGGCASVIDYGRDGILIESKNSQAIAEKIIELYEDQTLQTALGSAAYDKVSKEYNIETYAAKFINIYHQLLDGSDKS